MKKIKIKKIVATILALICASCLFIGCGPNLPSLEAPQRLRVNNDIVMWEGVENATEYVIVVNGQEYKTEKLYFDLSFLTVGDNYKIEIYAVGNEEQFAASAATSITATIAGKPVEPATKALTYTLLPDGSGYEVKAQNLDFSGLEGRVVIPDTYNGLPVKKIPNHGFGNMEITHGIGYIPPLNTVTTSVRLPSTLEMIDMYAFENCFNLEKINFPNGLRCIEGGAFSGCKKLMDIHLPETLEFLGVGAFYDTAWSNAHKEDEFMTLGHFLYKYHGDFEGDMDTSMLPQGIKYIVGGAFQHSKIKSITLAEDIKLIDHYTFLNCSNLEFASIKSMKKVYGATFADCENLETVVLPQGLTEIEVSAFQNCTALKNIYFGGTEGEFSTLTIGPGNEAFANATAYFYSEKQPTKTGNYWHYAEDGKTPMIW